jgi:hypothetical protein
MKKIAFCFLINDIINHEEIWAHYFSNIDKEKYSIYIHYKIEKKLKYFQENKIESIDTKYEDHSIPLAYNVLFRNAYEDEDNYKFVIVSGSCIPLKSFNFVYEMLTKDNLGYFNECPTSQCYPNCNKLLNVIEEKYISKSHNWFILNRRLVKELCFDNDDFLKNNYNTVYAPAEYFYYTFIKLLGLQKEIVVTHNQANNATTFTNWEGMDYKYPSKFGLKNYNEISEEELLLLLRSRCIFGRKFTTACFRTLLNSLYIKAITS